MKWKVCGMRDPQNIRDVLALEPDWMGFIFYPPSPRYVKATLDRLPSGTWSGATKRIGVFVSPSLEELSREVDAFQLHGVQWHGTPPSPEIRDWLKKRNIYLIQVVSVDDNFQITELINDQGTCDFVLFDTKSSGHGGSGKVFDHSFLPKYPLDIPFLLAGGLTLPHIHELPDLSGVPFWGVDVNSRFESSPGIKDTNLLKPLADFIQTQRNRT